MLALTQDLFQCPGAQDQKSLPKLFLISLQSYSEYFHIHRSLLPSEGTITHTLTHKHTHTQINLLPSPEQLFLIWGYAAQLLFLPVGVVCASKKRIWLQNSILTTIFNILYYDIYNISPKALLRLKRRDSLRCAGPFSLLIDREIKSVHCLYVVHD